MDRTASAKRQAILVGMGVHPGFADLLVVCAGRVLLLELKSLKGRLSPAQKAFRDKVTAQGFGWALVRSLDDALGALADHGFTTRVTPPIGGKRMAIRVTELARAGLTPDWMPGAVPRCVPVEVKRNHHGERAATIVVGTERVLSRGKWRTVEVLACPVKFSPHPQQIQGVRRSYEAWRDALGWIRDGMIAGGMLRQVEIIPTLPKDRSWSTR